MSAPIVQPLKKKIDWLDGAELGAATPTAIDYLVDNFLPAGTAGDVFGPPNDGKTSVLISLALNIAACSKVWFGRAIKNGHVMILGGEKSSRDVWVRDYHRAGGGDMKIEPGRFRIAPTDLGTLFAWTRDGWQKTPAYKEVVAYAKDLKPVLTVCDTIGRIALGQNPIDITQQQMLAIHLEELREEIGGTLLTVSHTNQSSRQGDLYERLHYSSRAGSNGLPGHLRWLAGVTRATVDESAALLGYKSDDDEVMGILKKRKIICFAVSKPSEMPEPETWSIRKPAVCEMTKDGRVSIINEEEMRKNDPRPLPSMIIVLSDTNKPIADGAVAKVYIPHSEIEVVTDVPF